jgi:secondary thiamine-phosphate synthase enzyme
MPWIQKEFSFGARKRGFHLVTSEVVSRLPEVETIRSGILHLFLKHTSASLSINENADPSVRVDMERHFNEIAPENAPYYTHDTEGSDDMPAHIKCSLIGTSLMMPITDGRLNLGTWQGIYLCEHRDDGGPRTIVATIVGD